MRWWDSSALVTLVSEEGATAGVKQILADDPVIAVWWATKVEGVSAVSRLRRTGLIAPALETRLLGKLDESLSDATEVPPSEELRTTACRLLRVHALTSADALQLAAALVWVEYRPQGAGFVCLDRKLCEAAAREGFHILPESD